MGNKKDKSELSRKKKHKKHKKRRDKEETEDIDVVTEDKEATQTLKLKIRFGGETLTSKVKGRADVSKDDFAGKVKKEVTEEDEEEEEKRNHCNDNEEDSWLDAMEKGDLDNYGEIRKNRDPAIMTARQRALKGESVEGEIELLQLPMYPERSMEEVEEIERKRKLRAKKRRQDSKRKIEETKIQTIEKLLTKSQKVKKENKNTKKLGGAHIRYTSNSDGFFISLSEEVEFPLTAQEIRLLPVVKTCAVKGCSKPKRYSCSKTMLPVCSLECYKLIKK